MAIPFLSTPDRALMSTTQELIPVIDVADGVVIYKNGGAALIMESTSLNFGLLSEREQQGVIASYAGLLNSFNFPVQIVVRSQRKDITNYMRYLDAAKNKISNEKLLALMKDYKNFIKEAIQKRNVLSKLFYIIIPFTPYELGVTKSVAVTFSPGKGEKTLPFARNYVVRKARVALYPKRDHLIRQAQRLGVRLKPLGNEELITLFYDIYNQDPPVKEEKESFI
jgi:hypothetical protein